MKTIIVDDEQWILKQFDIECGNMPTVQVVGKFQNPAKALEFARDNYIELAFLDIKMPGMTGLELAESLREIQPNVIVIFVSAYEKYMAEAFRTQLADYYIIKPYDRADIENAVERARLLSGRLRKSVFIRTFGSFDVFIDGVPISFSDDKAKELLALIVNEQGGTLTMDEALPKLLHGRSGERDAAIAYNQILKRLQSALRDAKIENLVAQNEQGVFLYRNLVDCDVFSYADGDLKAIRQFDGKYMSDYSWADEERKGLLRQSNLLGQYDDTVARNTLCSYIHCKRDAQLTITYVNEAFLAVAGITRDTLSKTYHNSLRALIVDDDYDKITNKGTIVPNPDVLRDAELRIVNSKNEELWMLCKSAAIQQDEEIECMLIDISGLKTEQDELEQAAQMDPLTGLYNRRAAIKRIEGYVTGYGTDSCHALIMMDVDNFKAINDTYGHPFADTVLTDIAAILKRSFRSDDTVCRLGGDEMMIFLKAVTTKEQAQGKLEKVMESLRTRLKAKTQRGELTCSFGMAMYPSDADNYADLYRRADEALYAAKKTKNCAVSFSDIGSSQHAPNEITEFDTPAGQLGSADGLEALLGDFQKEGDIPVQIDHILETIGRAYDVSRAYIFELTDDGELAVNTFEWCAQGVTPEIDNLRRLPAKTLSPYYDELFSNNGLLNCYDVGSLSPELYHIVAPQGIKSMLQCVLSVEGHMLGLIGFDECRACTYWNGRQVGVLSKCAEFLSRILFDYRQTHGADYGSLSRRE